MHLVKTLPGEVLIAVVDGLGHGEGAFEAAEAAIAALDAHPPASVETLATHCHERIRRTRGVALTLASIEPESAQMTWLGVGNVEALLLHAGETGKHEWLTLRNGIVGDRMPSLRSSTVRLLPRDLIVIATDGVRSGFGDLVEPVATPAQIARGIIIEHTRANDDALVLVARVRE
jgi:negative regulator of sigma-B (phosphoserine phosphatase)